MADIFGAFLRGYLKGQVRKEEAETQFLKEAFMMEGELQRRRLAQQQMEMQQKEFEENKRRFEETQALERERLDIQRQTAEAQIKNLEATGTAIKTDVLLKRINYYTTAGIMPTWNEFRQVAEEAGLDENSAKGFFRGLTSNYVLSIADKSTSPDEFKKSFENLRKQGLPVDDNMLQMGVGVSLRRKIEYDTATLNREKLLLDTSGQYAKNIASANEMLFNLIYMQVKDMKNSPNQQQATRVVDVALKQVAPIFQKFGIKPPNAGALINYTMSITPPFAQEMTRLNTQYKIALLNYDSQLRQTSAYVYAQSMNQGQTVSPYENPNSPVFGQKPDKAFSLVLSFDSQGRIKVDGQAHMLPPSWRGQRMPFMRSSAETLGEAEDQVQSVLNRFQQGGTGALDERTMFDFGVNLLGILLTKYKAVGYDESGALRQALSDTETTMNQPALGAVGRRAFSRLKNMIYNQAQQPQQRRR